jgi:hypothetical protein
MGQSLCKNVAMTKKIFTKAKAINFTFRCIDDILSINNPKFANWIPLIYHKELEKRKE